MSLQGWDGRKVENSSRGLLPAEFCVSSSWRLWKPTTVEMPDRSSRCLLHVIIELLQCTACCLPWHCGASRGLPMPEDDCSPRGLCWPLQFGS